MMKNKTVTMRKQKVKKNYIKLRLGIFLSLAFALLLLAAFANELCPYDPNMQNYSISLQPPSREHLFGTDQYGRDMFSRVMAGSQISIFSTLTLVGIISVVGTIIGVICGYYGKKIDSIVMRISDICLAFPGLVFALAVAAVLDSGIQNAVIALAVIHWAKYSRIARSQTLTLKNCDYIFAAKLAGSTSLQIMVRHILPNILGSIFVTAVLDIGTMMMELAGFSFLGLGAQPPTAEWGSMMSTGRSMLQTYSWVVVTPGIAIFISVVVFNLLGDTLRDYLDSQDSHLI